MLNEMKRRGWRHEEEEDENGVMSYEWSNISLIFRSFVVMLNHFNFYRNSLFFCYIFRIASYVLHKPLHGLIERRKKGRKEEEKLFLFTNRSS